MQDLDKGRLSVALIDVDESHENDFHVLAREFAAILLTKGYGRAETIRDEAHPLRFYAVYHWTDARCAQLHPERLWLAVQLLANNPYLL